MVLTFALLSLLELCADHLTGGMFKYYFVSSSYTGSILYVLGNANFEHYWRNMLFLLLLGPILEEKYGSLVLLIMIVATTVYTSAANLWFLDGGMIGSSGIVYMMIVLAAIVGAKENTIPLTFILVVFIYIGKEILAFSSPTDLSSHFAHIFGGLMGGILGTIFTPLPRDHSD